MTTSAYAYKSMAAALKELGKVRPEARASGQVGSGQPVDEARKSMAAALKELGKMRQESGTEAGESVGRQPVPEAGGNNAAAMPEMSGSLHMLRNCLNGGEISPDMSSRFDQQRHQSGSHSLLNMCPLPTGGITKRPGMAYMGEVENRGAARLIPFVFSASQSRILCIYSVGESYANMRIWHPDGTSRAAGIKLPFTAEIIRELSFCQSADVIFVAHPKIRPAKIMRYGDDDWRYKEIAWTPAIRAPEWDDVGPAGNTTDGENRRVTLEYVCTAIDAETGEESAPSTPWKLSDQHPLNESRVMEVRPAAVPGASEYRIYKKSAGVFGYIGRVTEPDENGRLTFRDNNIAPDVEDTPPEHRDPFNGEGEYPSVVFMHQQRLGYAASLNRPLTMWLSQSGNFESMAASTPPADDDAMEATLAAPQANKILWAISDRAGLAFGTEGGEWLLAPAEGTAITPKNISFQPQTSYGSQPHLAPITCASSILFAQRGGHVVRDLGYSFQDDRYNATDVSILSRHMLADHPIISWCWQQEPYSILWAALDDGSMAALTYLREHEVAAWHRHQTNGKVLSLASIPDASGNNQVWLVTQRGAKACIERLHNFNERIHTDGPDNEPFQAECIPCLPEISTQEGSTWLLVKKINSIKCEVINSEPFQCQVISQNTQDTPLMNVPPRQANAAKHAFWHCPLAAGWRENSQLKLIFHGPKPVTLLGLVITMEVADAAGGQA